MIVVVLDAYLAGYMGSYVANIIKSKSATRTILEKTSGSAKRTTKRHVCNLKKKKQKSYDSRFACKWPLIDRKKKKKKITRTKRYVSAA